jgi:hypothetical protein
VAFRSMVADYEEASGNKIDYSIMPFMALSQKTVCALITGEVPDVGNWNASTITPQAAWDDRLTDITDVVESQRSQFSTTALLCSQFYNSARKERSFYFLPLGVGCIPFHGGAAWLSRPVTRWRMPRRPGMLFRLLQASAQSSPLTRDA